MPPSRRRRRRMRRRVFVRPHYRRLANGKRIFIKGHRRRNPSQRRGGNSRSLEQTEEKEEQKDYSLDDWQQGMNVR